MLKITTTTSFKKDYKRATKQNKNIKKLDDVLWHLANFLPLDKRFRDHKLSGNYDEKRECHIEPDWLLIYEIVEDELILYRVGTHSELFGK